MQAFKNDNEVTNNCSHFLLSDYTDFFEKLMGKMNGTFTSKPRGG